jgi:protein-S-isoprenylcysteine O-methyltransferase Ste14
MKVRRAIGTVILVLLYFGLAVAGGGGIRPFLLEPARVVVVIVGFGLSIAALFTEGSLSSGVREDRRNRWVLAVFGIIGLLSAWLPAYTERKGIWVIDDDVVRWIGVLLFAAGGVLRLWPVFVLGRRFSGLVAIQPGHTLVTGGIYRVVRNPSYLGLLISSFGWALAFRSGVGLLLVAVLIPPLVARIRSEERMLRSEFGDQYAEYCAHTWRLVPGLY